MNTAPIALVTGASRGIGKAIAKELAKSGFIVYGTYAHNKAEADETCKEIQELGFQAQMFQVNVAHSEEITAFFDTVVKPAGTLHVLVNNAGITKDGLLLRMKDQDFDDVISVNLRGAFICAREAAKLMVKSRYGRIINISSIVGEMGNAGQVNYAAAKAGLLGMTKAMAKELASRSITVNAITPGFITTDMTKELTDDMREHYSKSIPLGRLGTVDDIAAAVVFLASAQASYITGQVLGINGGLYC
ncbi:MAG: 3-oxoacyl-[acyl-carrier-protein] reductase [Desulfovibrionaceae bacterium]|nr:3-oxoacyl-[acyl-carrier-protein] reductase [Desulfovibrionaceae bacterium]